MKTEIEYFEDVKLELKQAAEMESQNDQLQKQELAPSINGKVDRTELSLSMGAVYEGKRVPNEDSIAGKLVQSKGDGKTMPCSAARPATMPTFGMKGATNQLTLFYGGRVCVFESIPAEKVQEIMLIAASSSIKPAETNNTDTQSSSFFPSAHTCLNYPQGTGALAALQALCLPSQKSSICHIQEFPIARRHSLQRFLEKRKERLATKSPYPSPPTKMDDSFEDKLENSSSLDSVNFKQSEDEFQPSIVTSYSVYPKVECLQNY